MKQEICGIYSIENLKNNKIYIGQSIDIERRFISHRSNLNNIKHGNSLLQTDWQIYGENNFIFKILEECNSSLLNKKEIFYIQKFNSFLYGYNRTPGGDNDFILSDDRIQNMIDNNPNKKSVCQFDIYGNLIKKYDGIKIASRETKVSKETISRCCQGKYSLCCQGYFWKFMDDCDCDYEFLNKNEIIKLLEKSNLSPVIQYDKTNNQIINIWKKISDFCNENNMRPDSGTSISACCKGKRKTAYGYKWKYYLDYLKELADIM